MTDRQHAKLNMYQTVLDACGEYEPVYGEVPFFKKSVNELSDIVSNIRQTERQQLGVMVKGTTKGKNNAEDLLVEQTIRISGALYVYAFTQNNSNLQFKVSVNKHMLYNMHNNDLLAKTKEIASEAAAHAPELEEFGISQPDIDALNQAITAYETLIVSPRVSITERKQHTESLVYLFAAANSVLFDKMDKLIGLFKQTHPDFVRRYKSARNLINTSPRKKTETPDAE